MRIVSVLDPAPVVSEINVVRLNNGWTRNVSWLKPEVDYCISGYNVNIKRAVRIMRFFASTNPNFKKKKPNY